MKELSIFDFKIFDDRRMRNKMIGTRSWKAIQISYNTRKKEGLECWTKDDWMWNITVPDYKLEKSDLSTWFAIYSLWWND